MSIVCTRSSSVKSYENETLIKKMQKVYFESTFKEIPT